MISFILPNPKKLQRGDPPGWVLSGPFSHHRNCMSASGSPWRRGQTKALPDDNPPCACACRLVLVCSQALRRHQFISITEQHVRSLIIDMSTRVWAWHDLNMIFSTESGLYIWSGGGVLQRNHGSLSSKTAVAGDRIQWECLFYLPMDTRKPSQLTETSRIRTNTC